MLLALHCLLLLSLRLCISDGSFKDHEVIYVRDGNISILNTFFHILRYHTYFVIHHLTSSKHFDHSMSADRQYNSIGTFNFM